MLSLMGKPIDVVKKLKEQGYKLIHIIDMDALNGNTANLDIYDKLTYFINVEVECAPKDAILKKLLSLKCRIVLSQPAIGFSLLKEKNLLVAKLGKLGDARSGALELDDFHDVILEQADEADVGKIASLGKRVIVSESDYQKMGSGSRKLVWGIILSSSS